MLVVTRKPGEKVIIGNHDCLIEVMIVEVRGDKVRIGIHAPSDIPINREEVYEAIQRQRDQSIETPVEQKRNGPGL